MVCLLPWSTFVFFPFRWSTRGRILLWGRHWRRRMYGLWQLLPPQQTRTLCQSCSKTWWDSFIRHLTSHREGEITYRAKVSSGSCRVLCNKKLWYHEQDVIRELSLSSFPLWLAEGFNVARLIYAAYCISVLKNVSEEDMKSSLVHKMRWNLSGGNMFHLERRKLLTSFHPAIYLPLFSLFWFSD